MVKLLLFFITILLSFSSNAENADFKAISAKYNICREGTVFKDTYTCNGINDLIASTNECLVGETAVIKFKDNEIAVLVVSKILRGDSNLIVVNKYVKEMLGMPDTAQVLIKCDK